MTVNHEMALRLIQTAFEYILKLQSIVVHIECELCHKFISKSGEFFFILTHFWRYGQTMNPNSNPNSPRYYMNQNPNSPFNYPNQNPNSPRNYLNPNLNSPRYYMYPPQHNYSPRKPDFFSRPRMICSCKLEFLDAGAFQKHLNASHAENPSSTSSLPSTGQQRSYQHPKK